MIEPDRPGVRHRHAGQDAPGEIEPAPDPAPLILTLALAPEHQARFDRLRTAHFPPERNVLASHVTLFHHLPATAFPLIETDLARTAGASGPISVAVTGLRSLGRGVAFALDSAALSRLRAELAGRWSDLLGAQDRQGFRPHITVQNKVEPGHARALLAQLAAEFSPFAIEATGLALWRYRGGPWEAAGRFRFASRGADTPELSPHGASGWTARNTDLVGRDRIEVSELPAPNVDTAKNTGSQQGR